MISTKSKWSQTVIKHFFHLAIGQIVETLQNHNPKYTELIIRGTPLRRTIEEFFDPVPRFFPRTNSSILYKSLTRRRITISPANDILYTFQWSTLKLYYHITRAFVAGFFFKRPNTGISLAAPSFPVSLVSYPQNRIHQLQSLHQKLHGTLAHAEGYLLKPLKIIC